MHKTFVICATLAIFGMVGATQAQERAAGGTTETQMTWTALKSQVETARTESAAAHTRIDKIVICNKKNMLYVPGVTGADTDGCIEDAVVKQLIISTSLVIGCGEKNQVYNQKTKKCTDVAGARRWVQIVNEGFKAGGTLYTHSHAIQQSAEFATAKYPTLTKCASVNIAKLCGDELKYCYTSRSWGETSGSSYNEQNANYAVTNVFQCN